MSIPESFIEEVIARSDIVEVIGERLHLKKQGREYAACCPFHQEKTPSFTISPEKQFYHCFGCGEHGNVVSFIMDYDHVEFPAAIEILANRLGLSIPRDPQQRQKIDRLDQLRQITAQASSFYRKKLKQTPKAIEFLKQRGLTGVTAARFALGFAPPGNALLREQVDNQVDDHIATGLLVARDDGEVYDRFRNRIIFPIRDARGHIIGFGGRVLDDAKPKYLNSPETELFHKGQGVYGLFESRQHSHRPDALLIVEGYMDVLLLAQSGFVHTVATLGTATTAEQFALLYRQTERLIFCFDGDNAGRRAANRALEVGLAQLHDGRDLRFVFLPEGEDPDSYVQKVGKTGFQQFLEQQSLGFDQFLCQMLDTELPANDNSSRAKKNKKAHQLIHNMPQGSLKQLTRRHVDRHHGLFGNRFFQKQQESLPKSSRTPPAPHPPEELSLIHLAQKHPQLTGLINNPEAWHNGEIPVLIQRFAAGELSAEDQQQLQDHQLPGCEAIEMAQKTAQDLLTKRRQNDAANARKQALKQQLQST